MGPFAGGTSHPFSPHFEPVPPSPIPMKKWEMGWEWAHLCHFIQMGQVCLTCRGDILYFFLYGYQVKCLEWTACCTGPAILQRAALGSLCGVWKTLLSGHTRDASLRQSEWRGRKFVNVCCSRQSASTYCMRRK